MRAIVVAVFIALVAMADASGSKVKEKYDVLNAGPLFENFIKEHNKEYKDDADKQVHFKAFVENLKKINEMNEKNPTATFGINKFADYTPQERQSMFGFKKN